MKKVEVVEKPPEDKDEKKDVVEEELFKAQINGSELKAAIEGKGKLEEMPVSTKEEPDEGKHEEHEKVSFEDLPDEAVLSVPVPVTKKELLWIRALPGYLDEAEALRSGLRYLERAERID